MFGHFLLFKMRIIKRRKKKRELNLWVCLNQLPSSVASALVRESVRVRANGLNKITQIIHKVHICIEIAIKYLLICRLYLIDSTFMKTFAVVL